MSWIITFEIIGDSFNPKQVDFEFDEEYDHEEILQIARLKCALTYSAYRVAKKEGFDY